MAVIYVVDDYAVHRDTVRAFLRHCGHQVETAADGAEALARLQAWRPDLIVLDLWMPKADGFAVLAALRAAAPPPIRVVVTTGAADMAIRSRAIELGAARVLVKGEFSMAALAAAVADVLGLPAGRPATAA